MSSGIWTYATEARGIADEIRDEAFVEGDHDELHEDLAGLTLHDWLDFRESAAALITRFAAATPSRRRRRKWNAPIHRLRLAAYQTCLVAALMLDQAGKLEPGDSYRRTLQRAAEGYFELRKEANLVLVQDYYGEILPFRRDD